MIMDVLSWAFLVLIVLLPVQTSPRDAVKFPTSLDQFEWWNIFIIDWIIGLCKLYAGPEKNIEKSCRKYCFQYKFGH